MLARMEAGYDPIGISIEKWKDLEESRGWDVMNAGNADNCALCETYWNKRERCSDCPLAKAGDKCTDEGSAYLLALELEDASIMIKALETLKFKLAVQDDLKYLESVGLFSKEYLEYRKEKSTRTYRVGDLFKNNSGCGRLVRIGCLESEFACSGKGTIFLIMVGSATRNDLGINWHCWSSKTTNVADVNAIPEAALLRMDSRFYKEFTFVPAPEE